MAEQLREKLTEAGIELRTCHEYANATVKYDPSVIYSFVEGANAVILPARVKLEPAKSRNRLALAWSRRKPCIVAPLPAYMKWVKDGENAIVAESADAFVEACIRLRDDPKLALKLAVAGHHIAMNHMDPRQIVHSLLGQLQGPRVTLVIPHYSPRLDYLKLAVDSAIGCQGVDLEIIVSSSSKTDPKPVLPSKVILLHNKTRLSFSQAINAGLLAARPTSDFLMIGNDDVIYSQNSIANMVRAFGTRTDIIMNPYSNCDKGWLHNDKLEFMGRDLTPGMTIEQFSAEDLATLAKEFPNGREETLPSPFCAFYSTMIPRNVFNKVGILSEEYQNGGEDADYCYRAKRFGISSQWTKSAFVFHFGGKTRKVSQEDDPARHIVEDTHNNTLMRRRWAKKRVAIWTGPAWEEWNLDSPEKTGIGGSELCAIRLAQQFAVDGNEVSMFGHHIRQTVKHGAGVIEMYHWTGYNPSQNYWDLLIASRHLSPIRDDVRAKTKVVWVHDVFLLGGVKKIDEYYYQNVDKFIVLSPWHREFFIQHHEVPAQHHHKIVIIGNGVTIPTIEPRAKAKMITEISASYQYNIGQDDERWQHI